MDNRDGLGVFDCYQRIWVLVDQGAGVPKQEDRVTHARTELTGANEMVDGAPADSVVNLSGGWVKGAGVVALRGSCESKLIDMFAHAPRLVQQRPVAPAVYERTPSYVPPLVPRSRAPSFHQAPAAPLPFPTHQTQPTVPPPVPASRPSPEPWVDALKDDVEAEFSLSIVDDVKAEKDTALAAATTAEERAAIQREYDESMADIRAQARAEFQRRVEAERERRLLGNYNGKDALIAEQHSIMESIARENIRRRASQSSSAPPPLQAPTPAQPQPQPSSFARQSQPIPIPVQRNRSRNGGPSGSVTARSVSSTPFASSSSSSSPRPFPTARRESITQHSSTRPLPSAASPATSVSSISNQSEPSSSSGSSYVKSVEVDRRYEEHRVAVKRREEEVRRKEASARRSAEEARRREEAAARHEEDARRKNEEATRRMREADLREQQVRAWEARTRKEVVLAQKEAALARTPPQAQGPAAAAAAAAPLIARVFSKEVWQSKPRSVPGATTPPGGKPSEWRAGRLVSISPRAALVVTLFPPPLRAQAVRAGGRPDRNSTHDKRDWEGCSSCGVKRRGCWNRVQGGTFRVLSLPEREQVGGLMAMTRVLRGGLMHTPFVRREATGAGVSRARHFFIPIP
ncbi:hypothetical protein BJV74DRAFT_794384 [Russula compacta]|nr:hypothetical protein BJV74DRAFT_794384 [Russula compacta]